MEKPQQFGKRGKEKEPAKSADRDSGATSYEAIKAKLRGNPDRSLEELERRAEELRAFQATDGIPDDAKRLDELTGEIRRKKSPDR